MTNRDCFTANMYVHFWVQIKRVDFVVVNYKHAHFSVVLMMQLDKAETLFVKFQAGSWLLNPKTKVYTAPE